MKIVVAGNCQAMPLKKVLLDVLDNANVTAYTIHNANDKIGNNFTEDVKNADLVLSFKVSDNFRVKDFRPTVIRENAGAKFKSITNLFFSGYHPDYSYINDVSGKRLQGVLGDYHSKVCLIGCLLEHSTENITEAMISKSVGLELGYAKIFKKSLQELRQRDTGIDIGYAERFISIAYRDELFLTFNHPKNYVFYDYVFSILDRLKVPYRKTLPYHFAEALGDGPVLSIHPLVSEALGGRVDTYRELNVKAAQESAFIGIEQFVESSRQYYSSINEPTRAMILSTPWAKRIVGILSR